MRRLLRGDDAGPFRSMRTERIISKRTPRSIAAICIAAALLGCLYPVAIVSAGSLLTVQDPAVPSDIIVVLGGDGPPRAARAAALWHQGLAPRILVTGRGDCNSIMQAMVEAGVDRTVFTTECRSATTWENAEFSAPILAGMHIRKALLVTSWFHSRRAMQRFSSLMPDIKWVSLPAERTKSYWRLVFAVDGVQIFKEYPKALFYDLRAIVMPELSVRISSNVNGARL